MRLWLALAVSFSVASSAQASGPVERLLQLLVHPGQPELLVVRYGAGVGSHGFLYSRDGGRTFKLLCSAIVSPDPANTLSVQRVSTRPIPETAATLLDEHGAVMFAQYGATWTDDGTGCTWSDVPALRDSWPLALELDPREPTTLWSVVSVAEGQRNEFELMRRQGRSWKTVGKIREVDSDKAMVDGSLVVFANAQTRRLYASMAMLGAKGVSASYLLRSDDDGAHWRSFALPKDQERLSLLAVDPTNPDRVLAAVSRDVASDSLLLSHDGGATFTSYFEPQAVGGVTFDETGRVYLGDIGEGVTPDDEGGLYTAARLGEPLTKIAKTAAIDCVHYDASARRLYACNGDRFGVMDPQTGTLDVLLRLDQVSEFVACEGKDMRAACQNQLNAGPSWCCAGHYPFTPICEDYDVTERPDHGRVVCGRSAREYERPDAGVAAPERSAAVEPAEGDSSCERGIGLGALCAAAFTWLMLRRKRAS
jgi:hypothetical protein